MLVKLSFRINSAFRKLHEKFAICLSFLLFMLKNYPEARTNRTLALKQNHRQRVCVGPGIWSEALNHSNAEIKRLIMLATCQCGRATIQSRIRGAKPLTAGYQFFFLIKISQNLLRTIYCSLLLKAYNLFQNIKTRII